MNLLMICYYYPPITDVGAKRSVAFSKYFRKHGWSPFVLSVKNPDRTYCSVGTDRPPEGVHTEYARSLVNLYWLLGKANGALARVLKPLGLKTPRNYFYDFACFPDHFFGWIPLATIRAARMIRRYGIDTIYVSCTPFSGGVIGLLLKILTRKPLVLDFRDPYVAGVACDSSRPRLRTAADRWLEETLLKHANLFVVTSRETRDAYVRDYPWLEGKIITIYNGFDPGRFRDEPRPKFDKFSVIYTGQFYDYGPHHRTYTDLFFKALAHLQESGDITPGNFQFVFFGSQHKYIEDTADRYGVRALVDLRPWVPYEEVLDNIARSHLMLLRIVKRMISTKLFDGIPLNVPFLATIPHGEVEEIIREFSPGSYVLTEEDSHLDVAGAIVNAMARYKKSQVPANHVDAFLARFTRECLTRTLMRAVEDTVTPKAGR